MITEHRFVSFDRTTLYYRRVTPKQAPKALIFLLHGIGEHGGRYLSLAGHLAEIGLESWVLDLRGFGLSGGKRGWARSFLEYETDLISLYSCAQRNHDTLPIFFLGHSFGGLLAAAAASRGDCARIRGIILSSPLFGIAIPLPFWQRALARLVSVILPDFTQNNHVDGDLLTHDPQMRLRRASDSLVHHKMSVRLYTEILKKVSECSQMAMNIHCSALILQAGEDRIVSISKTEAFFRNIPARDKILHIYDGWYHEILNEIHREQIFSLVGQWITERL